MAEEPPSGSFTMKYVCMYVRACSDFGPGFLQVCRGEQLFIPVVKTRQESTQE